MHDLNINSLCALLISKSRSFQKNKNKTILDLLAVIVLQSLATLTDSSAFLSPPFLVSHAFYFPLLLFVSPSNTSVFLFFTAKSLPPSSQKLVECHHVSPVQHSPTFCLCVSYTSAHWAIAAVIHLFISHADLLSRIALCKINIVPSMPVLHPLSCHVSSFPFVTSLSFFCLLCLIYFVE